MQLVVPLMSRFTNEAPVYRVMNVILITTRADRRPDGGFYLYE